MSPMRFSSLLRLAAPLVALACALAAVATPAARASEHALVLTNNKGLALGRPDLQYADDDGAKWAELFDALYGPDATTLLTTLDAPTRARFPELAARLADRGASSAPTKASLEAAFARLGATLAAEPAGARVVTIVFAGHGDVADGEGFLELEDARLTASDLARLVAALPAERIHLVIDACNAWFMLYPRKPGARRIVRHDLGGGLLERDPRVGALLSTSAEATTWEWSEIESGLFSHALRSGLRGGADVDRDRRVTYRELDAFLAIAHAAVPEAYRPRLFVRGPRDGGGDGKGDGQDGGDTALVSIERAAHRPALALPTARHIALRDARGVRVLDGHFEAGAPLALVVPDGPLVLDEAVTRDGRTTRRHLELAAADAAIAIAPMPTDAPGPDTAARGDAMRVENLFAEPFGREAFARWEAAPPAPDVPYGVTRRDAEVLGNVLATGARMERRSRMLGGVVMVGLGLFAGGLGADGLARAQDDSGRWFGGIMAATGAIGLAAGTVALIVPDDLEHLEASYAKAPRDSEHDRALTVARFERLLARRAHEYRDQRRIGAAVSIGIGVVGLGLGVWSSASRGEVGGAEAALFGLGAVGAGLGVYGLGSKHEVEEVWELYLDLREVPWKAGTAPPLTPVLAPIEGGLVLGVNGGF